MKKTKKRFFGCLGLGAVVAMTAVAIALPSPQASAITTITDNLTVHVEGIEPVIDGITVTDSSGTELQQKDTTTDPHLTVTTPYNNGVVSIHYTLTYTYTNADGTDTVTFDPLMDDYETGYTSGTVSKPLNLDDERFNINGTHGYGHYVLTVTGVNNDGVTDEESFEFYYSPFLSSAEQNDDTGDIDINITDIDTENVNTIDVYVNGELVGTINVDNEENIVYNYTPDDTTIEQDFVIVLVANDENGDPMFISDEMNVHYVPLTVPDTGPDDNPDDSGTGSPDTGGLFHNLNITKEDYLVTGLIAFFIVGIVGFGIVARGRKETRSSKRR
ncbi:hypothetical protein IKT18_00360 [Candidatus Saccharibacteria bacterium]|nr:hypothetical protein [Candidatus Saccharibacteria bacterium]